MNRSHPIQRFSYGGTKTRKHPSKRDRGNFGSCFSVPCFFNLTLSDSDLQVKKWGKKKSVHIFVNGEKTTELVDFPGHWEHHHDFLLSSHLPVLF